MHESVLFCHIYKVAVQRRALVSIKLKFLAHQKPRVKFVIYAGFSSAVLAGFKLETIRCVEVELVSRRKLCVTRGNQHAQQVLRIRGITQLDPPTPAEGQKGLM